MRDWGLYLARRVGLGLISLWFLMSATFLLVTLAPSDPARAVAGPYATQDQIAAVSHRLGLDQSLWHRYTSYFNDLFHGSLGTSLYGSDTIASDISKRLPGTLELIILSLIVALVLGVALGGISAYYHRRWPDRIASGTVGVLQSLPDFVLGVVLLYVLSYLAGAVPGPEGQLSITTTPPPRHTGMILIDSLLAGDFGTFQDAFNHAILPVLTLGLVIAALFARISRAALRESLDSDQTTFARACGLSELRVFHYALLTSRTPLMTYGAIVFGSLFGGTAIVERIYNWNGVSQWAVGSMQRSDYPAVQGFVLLAGVVTLVVYIVLDIAIAAVDPRVRTIHAR